MWNRKLFAAAVVTCGLAASQAFAQLPPAVGGATNAAAGAAKAATNGAANAANNAAGAIPPRLRAGAGSY